MIGRPLRTIFRSQGYPPDNNVIWLYKEGEGAGNFKFKVFNNGLWETITGADAVSFIVKSETDPEDTNKIWVSNTSLSAYTTSNPVIAAIVDEITDINNTLTEVSKLINYGIIAGDSVNSTRQDLINSATPIDPRPVGTSDNNEEEVTSGSGTAIEPDTTGFEPTVPNISIKMDTTKNFQDNIQNLIDGEPCWVTDKKALYIYYEGKFYAVGGSGSGGGLDKDAIMAAFFNYLGFITDNNNQYRINIDDNARLNVYAVNGIEITPSEVQAKYGRLYINEIFCGGEDNDKYSFQSCSHNFIELSNATEKDLDLNNLCLMYAPNVDTPFKYIILKGQVKAGSTYLIRGKQCSCLTNTTVINVDNYDLEWYDDEEDDLISFAQESPVFYLAQGTYIEGVFKVKNASKQYVIPEELNRVVYNSSDMLEGYIDSIGINTDSAAEGSSPVTIVSGDNWSDLLFSRYFDLDPVTQANYAYASRKSNIQWTYINLSKKEDTTLTNPRYYYSEERKKQFTPRRSKFNKTIFTSRSRFNPYKPNMINITFGKQATYKDSSHKASRCFNWVSVGYYNEYLEYRKSTDTTWTKVYSRNDYTGGKSIYNNIRWITTSGIAVTTHKVVLSNIFDTGTYYYRVGRDNDNSYLSNNLEFTVVADSDVTSFNFIQVSDQQGFNWLEYQVWKKSAKFIADNEFNNNISGFTNSKFTINTGDITQNGNRENEWLDYYEGRQFLRNKEEMFTIGNNDLCGVKEYELGDGTAGVYKISHKNILFYYTFEVDEDNINSILFEYAASDDTTKTFCMPSLYSFNYGVFHFVSINSEFAANTGNVYDAKDNAVFMKSIYSQMAAWFKKDLQIWKNDLVNNPSGCSKCIVFTHEMPYTIVTYKTQFGSEASGGRKGSKLNTTQTTLDNKTLNYMWSRLFKQYGIRLVIGGHKHTYSITKPVYDAPANYINETTHLVTEGADLFGNIDAANSLRPVVQVTNTSEIIANSPSARYQLVQTIDAPVYVMCQATGYKLVSNQEIPCRQTESAHVDWLKRYFPGNESTLAAETDTANIQQYRPTYIRYSLNNNTINIKSYQVKYIYTEPNVESNKAGNFNINNQSITAMDSKLITISDESTGNDYTITL